MRFYSWVLLIAVSSPIHLSYALHSRVYFQKQHNPKLKSASLFQFSIPISAVEEIGKLQRKGIISFLIGAIRDVKLDHGVLKELSELWNPLDLTYLAIPALVTGPLLHLLDRNRKERAANAAVSKEPCMRYLIEYLEDPLIYLSKFPLWLFFLDIISAFIEAFGVTFHVRANIPDLVAKLSGIFMVGLYLTRIKDFVVERWVRPSGVIDFGVKNDPVRAAAISELTSVLIWLLVALVALEVASLKLGVTLGSLFALGGIGSASVVLALRSTAENAIGGLLLKLQDKFRIGEVISLPGGKESPCMVEELNYINTRLRRPDNSLLVVPNHSFTKGEIVNWSRTPYRLFKTSIAVAVPNLQGLNTLVQKIRGKLLEVSDIESTHRDVIVAATGFKDNKVIVDIDIHLKSTNEFRCAEIKTEVIDMINTCLVTP